MGYAWAPQITGLVMGEPKPGQRHRSNGLAICMEAMEERASKSPTLDRSMSIGNVYEHRYDTFKSGTDTWEEMCAEASLYRSKVTLPDGRTAERGLRKDAVIGWAMILKPPPEMVAALGMETEDIARFCVDGFEAMHRIEPRLFDAENVEADAWHFDEGTPHLHRIGTSKDKTGKYCGNLINANLCVRINQEWPALMRGMGWPMDDLDMTDWKRMGEDDEYREEREAKRKRQGRSVEQYAKQKAEDAGAAAAGIVQDAKAKAAETTAHAEAVQAAIRRKIKADMDDAKKERDQAVKERDQAIADRAKAQEERDQAVAARNKAQAERDQAIADRNRAQAAHRTATSAVWSMQRAQGRPGGGASLLASMGATVAAVTAEAARDAAPLQPRASLLIAAGEAARDAAPERATPWRSPLASMLIAADEARRGVAAPVTNPVEYTR